MKKLRSMEIEPAENGGSTITHRFREEVVHNKGSMRGGMSTQYHEPESHVFGPNDGGKLLAHVAKHLNIPGAAEEAREPEHKGKTRASE